MAPARLIPIAAPLLPDRITELLRQAGIAVTARLVREAAGLERMPQACLLAHKV